MSTSKSRLCDPIAALGDARSLAYLLKASPEQCSGLRSVRLALGPFGRFFEVP